uniref:Uncharacterized protein n=1 Tax=Anguilla anguilla TaxID=7936 RepID=A0A0E9W5D3_ANGAN
MKKLILCSVDVFDIFICFLSGDKCRMCVVKVLFWSTDLAGPF